VSPPCSLRGNPSTPAWETPPVSRSTRGGRTGSHCAFLPLAAVTAALLMIAVVGGGAMAAGGRQGTPAAPGGQEPRVEPAGRSPEKMHLSVGLAGNYLFYLPLYIAVDHTVQDEGLQVKLVSFNGGTQVGMALASDSVDVALGSLNGVIGLIAAGQPVKAFYAGNFQTDFQWFARPGIRSWLDLKGRSVAISTYGSLTDGLTRYIIRRHGLEPGRNVQLVQAGETGNRFAALNTGRVDATVLAAPFTWYAEERGFSRLGSQATEVAPAWPQIVITAKERHLADSPRALRAFLRAQVRAIRLARSNPDLAIRTIMERLKFERAYAERAYLEVLPAFNERGGLPAGAMPAFWEITIASGEVTEPWPEARFLDRRFIDTFEEWAPK